MSLYVVLSIRLSILDYAAVSLFCACSVRVQFSAPYIVSGNTQELYTCLFRQMATMLPKRSRCLEYAVQRATILLFFEYTTPSTFSISTLFMLIGVLSIKINFVYAIFIFRHIDLVSSDSSCSICRNNCGVSVHRNNNVISKAEIGKKLSVYLHALVLPV